MSSLYLLFLLVFCKSSYSDSVTTPIAENVEIINETRRILRGVRIYDSRPYMVYLRPTHSENYKLDPHWVCGGVIIDERYILTSAACIEDVNYFYVVSGTHKWLPPTETNECIENGALRAMWKCIPRSYRYDGTSFNNIRWMVNDIAIVMTEDPFNFYKRIKGCDFIPQKIIYNNISKDYEAPGTSGFIAGWGSTTVYTDPFETPQISHNSPFLIEAKSMVIQKSNCKRYWERRYHTIIDHYMICGKQGPSWDMQSACDEHASCRQMLLPEELGPRSRRFESSPDKLLLHSARQVRKREKSRKIKTRRQLPGPGQESGGFCENDHGGPLMVGHGKTTVVIGVMSAYMTKNESKKCFGPFLYTSVYDNRFLIECAIYKELNGNSCSSVLRDVSAVLEEETFNWGPSLPRTFQYEENDYDVLRDTATTTVRSGNQTSPAADVDEKQAS